MWESWLTGDFRGEKPIWGFANMGGSSNLSWLLISNEKLMVILVYPYLVNTSILEIFTRWQKRYLGTWSIQLDISSFCEFSEQKDWTGIRVQVKTLEPWCLDAPRILMVPKKFFVTLHPSPPPKIVSLMSVRRFLGSLSVSSWKKGATPQVQVPQEIGGLATAKGWWGK